MIKNVMEYRRCDIYWCYLDDEGLGSEQTGKHPALIVQNDIGNKYSPTVIVAIGSSKIQKAKLPTHMVISKDKYTNLERETFFMAEQILTIDKSRLGDYIGTLDEFDTKRLDNIIKVSFQLGDEEPKNQYSEVIQNVRSNIERIDDLIEFWINKGQDVTDIFEEITQRRTFICELKTKCKEEGLKYYKVYDEARITNLMLNSNKNNKRMAV